MHERSLAKSLLRQVQAVASKHPTSRVTAIRVRVGEFSGIEPELLESAYDDLAQHTPLNNARLDLKKVPLEAECQQCSNLFRIENFNFQCPACGSVRLTICGGEELLLDSVAMEETEP